MALAQKKAKLDDCPDVSEEAKEKLAAAAAPPMRLVKFGSGDNEVQVGQETVMFRHEEKFHNPTVVGVTALAIARSVVPVEADSYAPISQNGLIGLGRGWPR